MYRILSLRNIDFKHDSKRRNIEVGVFVKDFSIPFVRQLHFSLIWKSSFVRQASMKPFKKGPSVTILDEISSLCSQISKIFFRLAAKRQWSPQKKFRPSVTRPLGLPKKVRSSRFLTKFRLDEHLYIVVYICI